MTSATTFRIGATYTTGEGHDYVWHFTVTARTAKFLTLVDKYGDTTRVGVYSVDGVESALPLGRYSMAPVITAARLAPELVPA